MRVAKRLVQTVGLGVLLALVNAHGQGSVPLTLVNYSQRPVYATTVALDEAELDSKLGVPAGTPVRVRSAKGSAVLPVVRGQEQGRAVLWLYASLASASRLDLVAERADRWPAGSMTAAQCEPDGTSAVLRNGLIHVQFGKRGWDLGFESSTVAKADNTVLVRDGELDFWVDDQNRGRILNGDPKQMGLVNFNSAKRLEKCEALLGTEAQPVFKRVHRLTGLAKNLTVTETFELVPGLPLLVCRVHWQNDGDTPLWVAYVRSGDGIKGRWGEKLMAGPLVERKKSPIEGDLNGGETRSAWLGGLCRISMESLSTGCGVGMSTLLPTPGKVGTGSMIWGCGASGFQCNFIDPVQGQFPFLVKPHEGLDNGFAFLATQAGSSVFRQTVELWKALQEQKLPRLAPACAVFVGGQPVQAQTVQELGDVPALLQGSGPVRQAALRMDFNKFYQCRVSVGTASPQASLELRAQPLGGSKPAVTLLRAEQPGEYAIELNKSFRQADEIAFVLEARANGNAALKGLSVAETLPASPRMLSPVPDATFSDFATMFRWESLPMVVEYDVQWSRSVDFSSPTTVRVVSSQNYPWYLPPDEQLLAPGVWHWRLRGVKGTLLGAWSAPRAFTVDNDHTRQPLRRPMTAASPLFTLEATRVLDYTKFNPEIPEDIRPYMGIIAEGYESKGITVDQFARGMEKLPYSFMMRSHWGGLADVEWLCQHVPNFVGIQGGEHLSSLYQDGRDGAMRYHQRRVKICAKYGLIYQEADGTYKEDKWQDLMDQQGKFIREYGKNIVLSQKNNIIRRQFYSQSAAMGLWLGGITYQHGAWEDGGFYWQNAGFTGLGQCRGERTGVLATMPRIFWDLVCVMGISRGCGLYSLDGQTLMYSAKAAAREGKPSLPSAIWAETGETSDTFKRFVVPLVRGTVRHGLIPTKEEVFGNVKLAVYNDKKVPGDEKTWAHYVEYGPLYAGTYGFGKMGNIDGQLWEFFPNTGRYYFIPVLPQGNEPLGHGIKNLPVSELQSVARVQEVFNPAYSKWYEGDALVARVGNTLTVMNSHENEDVTESYAVPLAGGLLESLSGKVGPHSYLVGKLEEQNRRLWLQANTEYPERDTVLSIACSRKPKWQVEPASAAKEARWNETEKKLELRLAHEKGAVEVEVQ